MYGKLHIVVFAVIVLLCSAGVLHAQDEKYAGAFLEIPVGAKSLAMGGAYTAISSDESAFHYNPAGVALTTHKLAGFMYSAEYGLPGSSLANFWHLGFTYPLESMALSANWVRLSVGDLLHTPDLTNVTVTDQRAQMVREIFGGTPDYFSDNEDEIVLSVARNNKIELDWGWLYYKQHIEVPIGINFKVIHQGIGDFGSANGIGVDAGAQLRFSAADFLMVPSLGNISFGVTGTDLFGTKLNWSTQRQHTIPMHLTGGIAYAQPIPWFNGIVTGSTDFLIAEREKMRFGLDVTYEKYLSLRVGFNRGLFTAGAGFIWEYKVNVNYSLGINNDLGPEHRVSFSVDLDNILKHEEKQ